MADSSFPSNSWCAHVNNSHKILIPRSYQFELCSRWTTINACAILRRAKPVSRFPGKERGRETVLLKKIFTWWDGATIGAVFDIRRRSQFVGEDDVGNRYFEERKPSLEGRKRRWVIYPGYPEASSVPPVWSSWLHHTIDEAPSSGEPVLRAWEKPHQPNLTGTALAYKPKGSLSRQSARPKVAGDYEAWRPEGDS
ncbi:MAG: NADH:ubiquinone oxidoreductase subunit NDUFA12 [Caulobacterales bacterium]